MQLAVQLGFPFITVAVLAWGIPFMRAWLLLQMERKKQKHELNEY